MLALRHSASAFLLIISLGACATHQASTPPEPADWAALGAERLPALEPCQPEGLPEALLCGTLEVFEDRAAGRGRRIGLHVVVVPARSANPPADPVFIFEGGPGGAATGRALSSVYAGPVRARDIVLVDQRGTGRSNPLNCDLDAELRPGARRQMFPPERVRACAGETATRAETRFYTTAHFADDIEELRQRLGYGKINVRGGSYGTWAMMVYAQRYPESVRTLFGIGMTSPLRSNLAERGIYTDRTLNRLGDRCATEPTCAALAPDLAATTSELLDRLAGGPRTVELADPEAPEETLRFDLSRAWLAEQMRLILYFGFTSRALPWAVYRAHHADDWAPLAAMALQIERSFRSSLAQGLALTVQCSEMMDFDVDAALKRGANTLVGNYRLEQQLQGCAAWPHTREPLLGVEDVRTLDVPALFLSGALDPVTPPEYAEDAKTYFPNSHHLVLEEGQHGPFDLENSWECVHKIWSDFLERGTLEGLDTACAEGLNRPAFVLNAEGFAKWMEETW